MSLQQHQQFTQQIVGNYICSYGILPSPKSGGDINDFFKISDSKYGIYLIDVAGIGKSSVTAIKQVKDLIISLALSEQQTLYSQNPELLLQQTNLAVYNAKLGKYLTLIYGVLDLESNYFNYSIAGHYPNPILLDQNGHAKYLFGKGFPIGILPNATFEKFTIQIPTNNSILLFSDGIMRFLMPHENMEYRSNYLLNIICNKVGRLIS